jgi:hypothetical protein
VTVEIDVGRMTAHEMGHAARFCARLREHWGDEHKATGELFGRLTDALTRCQVDLEMAIARREVADLDSLGSQMALGLVDPDEVPLGWIGEPVADETPEPDEAQASEPDDADPVSEETPDDGEGVR